MLLSALTMALSKPLKRKTEMSDYTLNTEAAKQADKINTRIESKGDYVGQFTRAEAVTSSKGTKGVDFSFAANNGATADYLTIWTHNKDGEEIYGFNVLMAIMTCLKVKDLTAVQGQVEKYDKTAGGKVTVTVPLFRDLMNKPIGLLIFMEEYVKNSGGSAWKPVIASPFDKDGFTASEILNRVTTPQALPSMIDYLRDRPLKVSQGSEKPSNPAPSDSAADFVDDCPF